MLSSTTVSPQSRDETLAALQAVLSESELYWQSLPTDRFLASIGEAWSPAENVRHLTKSIRAVTVGLCLPRWLLAVRFGWARSPSRSFDALHAVYLERLAQGASAGRFAPSARQASPDPEGQRREIVSRHRVALNELHRAAEHWPERALDRRLLPHPALGKLTVREMLFFTLFHYRHHLVLVQGRLASLGVEAGTT